MHTKFMKFLTSDAGAVTVDWVILAAVTVGLGVSTAAAVRTGMTSLSGEINTTLDTASVAAFCQGGQAPYEIAYLSAEQGAQETAHLDRRSDEELLETYRNTQDKALDIYENDPERINEMLDYVHLIEQERLSRGLERPEGTQPFEDLNTYMTGAPAAGGTECGYGPGSGGSGGGEVAGGGDDAYAFLGFNDEEAERNAEQFASYGDDELRDRVDVFKAGYARAADERNQNESGRHIDAMHLVHQELISRDTDPRAIADAEDAFNGMLADYNERYPEEERRG